MAQSTPKAVIFGCAGLELTAEEKAFFSVHNPYGFILFARNCNNPEQVRKLVVELRTCVGGRNAPVLIDQEGGRVARLKPPHWRKYPAARQIADLADTDPALAAELIYLNSRLIADELISLGINVDCLPLADVPVQGSHDIIGDRAYGYDPARVAALGREAAQGLMDSGVLPVLKHIPGHGRAMVDSHESLPHVTASLEELRKTDFSPFNALADLPFGMTAHILYDAIDPKRVATMSPTVIRMIRDEIGFDGMLMSDDLSMKALSGDFAALAKGTLEAGCDLVLHCNGKMEEMEPVANATPPLSPDAQRRAKRVDQLLSKQVKPFDVASALATMASALPQEIA